MQDEAAAHIYRPVKEQLTVVFEDLAMSRLFVNINAWPPKSSDLKPADYWL